MKFTAFCCFDNILTCIEIGHFQIGHDSKMAKKQCLFCKSIFFFKKKKTCEYLYWFTR